MSQTQATEEPNGQYASNKKVIQLRITNGLHNNQEVLMLYFPKNDELLKELRKIESLK